MRKLFASAVALTALALAFGASAQTPCQLISEAQVADLMARWNESLTSQDPWDVVKFYSENAIFLPTFTEKPRTTQRERFDYYSEILKRHPQLKVEQRAIHIGCNMANDTGTYIINFKGGEKTPGRYSITYQFVDGQWLIVAHLSSLVPVAERH